MRTINDIKKDYQKLVSEKSNLDREIKRCDGLVENQIYTRAIMENPLDTKAADELLENLRLDPNTFAAVALITPLALIIKDQAMKINDKKKQDAVNQLASELEFILTLIKFKYLSINQRRKIYNLDIVNKTFQQAAKKALTKGTVIPTKEEVTTYVKSYVDYPEDKSDFQKYYIADIIEELFPASSNWSFLEKGMSFASILFVIAKKHDLRMSPQLMRSIIANATFSASLDENNLNKNQELFLLTHEIKSTPKSEALFYQTKIVDGDHERIEKRVYVDNMDAHELKKHWENIKTFEKNDQIASFKSLASAETKYLSLKTVEAYEKSFDTISTSSDPLHASFALLKQYLGKKKNRHAHAIEDLLSISELCAMTPTKRIEHLNDSSSFFKLILRMGIVKHQGSKKILNQDELQQVQDYLTENIHNPTSDFIKLILAQQIEEVLSGQTFKNNRSEFCALLFALVRKLNLPVSKNYQTTLATHADFKFDLKNKERKSALKTIQEQVETPLSTPQAGKNDTTGISEQKNEATKEDTTQTTDETPLNSNDNPSTQGTSQTVPTATMNHVTREADTQTNPPPQTNEDANPKDENKPLTRVPSASSTSSTGQTQSEENKNADNQDTNADSTNSERPLDQINPALDSFIQTLEKKLNQYTTKVGNRLFKRQDSRRESSITCVRNGIAKAKTDHDFTTLKNLVEEETKKVINQHEHVCGIFNPLSYIFHSNLAGLLQEAVDASQAKARL